MKTLQDQFEEWAHEKHLSLPVCRTIAYNQHTQLAWEAWKASRDSIEITLPERIDPEYKNDYWSGVWDGFNRAVQTCRISIEQAGVRIKE